MGITLDDMKSTISKRDGLARSNRFNVYMNIPMINVTLTNIITNLLRDKDPLNGALNNPRDVTILCETTGVPGIDFNIIETAYGIKRRKLVNSYDQQDIQFTFLLTNDYFAKNFLNNWVRTIMNQYDGTFNYKSEYASDIIIQQLDVDNNVLGGAKLVNAYPINIQEMMLSNTQDNDITRITATFTYDYAVQQSAIVSAIDGGATMLKSYGNIKIGF
jgi:hypothetical protein